MTNPFYSSEETERSRVVLGEVVATVPDAVLIGGWGTWVRTRGPMSHDIDLILSRQDLASIQAVVDDLSVSRHLAGTKWRGSWRSIHLDLYVPYESRLGANLQLRAETLRAFSETVDGYRVLAVGAHVATKIAALLDRPDSLPGHKDREEILALLDDPLTGSATEVMLAASARTSSEVQALMHRAFAFLVEDPQLNRQGRSRVRELEARWQTLLSDAIARRPRRGVGRHTDLGLGL